MIAAGDSKSDNMNELHQPISSFFGSNVFGTKAMEQYLTKNAILAVHTAIETGESLSRETADEVAEGMKNWAVSKGATHYTHWFQPLRGTTAEKHDSFFEPTGNDSGVESFSGKALVQQEPDASSFPSGGIRNTFEARGYSAWDPSSPAFIIEKSSGITLCIPTVFVSYTGFALDYKTPMLRATHFLERVSTKVCQLFGSNVSSTSISLGVEQEYFLVDLDRFHLRPDLMLSGRTLVGHAPAKGQQLEDHYFGSIPERVFDYMTTIEKEALKLGIPLKTRHNEVAPAQFECAPMFETINLAIDHNSLLMDLMDALAPRHGFKVLFHEKPYKGVNGSGKHNNWSIITNTGVNLLSPGNSPMENLQFLTFFINTIKAVHDYADLLRASISSAGNDHRLGANEAPPAIMSIFIGSTLTQALDDFENEKTPSKKQISDVTKLNIPYIPPILLDNTDRNRTSPFAFTGNKFELRAVGSSENCASSMIVLNTIVGNQLNIFMKDLEKYQKANPSILKEQAITQVLRGYIKTSRKILFEGNGYSETWVKEAAKRKLSNIKNTPYSLDTYLKKESVKLFTENSILSEKELEARTDIKYENYTLKIQIEGRILGDLVNTFILPSAFEYQNTLLQNISLQKELKFPPKLYASTLNLCKQISGHIEEISNLTYKMVEERKAGNIIKEPAKKAKTYCDKVFPYFEQIRYHADKLERLIDDEHWRLPKYRELLFIK